MRKRRADGRAAPHVPAYRRVMPYLMRGRNESAVYFEQQIDLTRAVSFIDAFNDSRPDLRVTPFHVITWAIVKAFDAYPRMNRFVAGGRLYDRDGIWISYSAKKEMAQDAPLVVVKQRFDPDQSFQDMVAAMSRRLADSRSERESRTDKELKLVLKAQGLPLRAVMALERFADSFGLLPRSYIEGDPLFASIFIANLGSLKMEPPWHHLYEYGSISIFCVIGRVTESPVVVDGRVEPRTTVRVRFSFDERVEDGMYAYAALSHMTALVEDPAAAGINEPS